MLFAAYINLTATERFLVKFIIDAYAAQEVLGIAKVMCCSQTSQCSRVRVDFCAFRYSKCLQN